MRCDGVDKIKFPATSEYSKAATVGNSLVPTGWFIVAIDLHRNGSEAIFLVLFYVYN